LNKNIILFIFLLFPPGDSIMSLFVTVKETLLN
jgi:hypothetical protein